MNIKTTLLSLLTLSTLTAPVLAGYEYDGVHLMDGSDFKGNEVVAGEMIDSLTEMGIPVVDGGKNDLPMCEKKGDSYMLGAYAPGPNIMIICTQNGNSELMMETLTHEVVHVIQDARAGINNDEMIVGDRSYFQRLVNALHPSKAQTIQSLYEEKDWAVEVEAFHWEDQPEVVNNELKKFVF